MKEHDKFEVTTAILVDGGFYRRIGNFIDSRKGKEQMNGYNQIPLRGERKCGCES